MPEIKRGEWTVIAGPCAAESCEQILLTAKSVMDSGAQYLRAGLWKPRTSADSWQGSGDRGVEWMIEAKRQTGVKLATEVKDTHSIDLTLRNGFELLWIGSRSAQHYPLLEEIGKATSDGRTIVMLKRGMGTDLKDWLGAASYITRHNTNVILCERGVRGFGTDTRNTPDLQTAWLAQKESGLPVIIDPSHAAGRADLITPMSLATKAAGLSGLIVEVHPDPANARTDSKQQLNFEDFGRLMNRLRQIPSLNA